LPEASQQDRDQRSGDPRLKVDIVGHTDNQGSLDSNLALSRVELVAQ
jgi:outer membrane protein OmpA-like peptidoglycan-associated protein